MAWSRKTWKFLEQFLRFFGKTTPYGKIVKILFQTFSLPHRLTLLCWNVVKFVRREIDIKTQNFGSLSNCRYCVDRAQNLPGPAPPPTFGSQCPKFHPNRFTFGGVIAERVKAVLLAHRVFATFVFGRIKSSKTENCSEGLSQDNCCNNGIPQYGSLNTQWLLDIVFRKTSQELIRRWDSKRQLFTTIWHVRTSKY